MTDCIFCKIASKEMKANVLHETEDLVVIEDINPQAPTHLLVIPKRHYATLVECDDTALLGRLLCAAAEAAVKAGVAEKGFRTVINTNAEAGQTVFHLHVHVLGGRAQTGKMG